MIAPTWGCAVEVQEFEKDSRGRLSLQRGAVGVREQLGRFLTIPQSALLTAPFTQGSLHEEGVEICILE